MSDTNSTPPVDARRKGPLSFLSGSLTSLLLAWLSLGLSKRMVLYFAEHPPHYSSAIAQSIASALKTLLTGMCFVATFSFAFIGLGLALVFLRSLFTGRPADPA
ncbi:uncharacterized membrane protein (DUF3082) [Synechococcus sp. RS9909]|uniref:DUF3082 domain-containing protein n=1 Tax=unclassified Synechococcus TaxID=2626047 RepID=UPI000068F8BE|nr:MULTISPECIES: DUF3082 domain-containing protein [unclassified Synechococcus]EAQ69102.1 hypothetical protein RS9917_11700 [Synechococcus sp. RS9917]QNI79640.1 uncharacterized membrane protein (DUF3082) [Synechococcus sp. RS9909]